MKVYSLMFVFGIFFSLNAGELNFNKNFVAGANGEPDGWVINTLEEYKPFGTVKVVKGDDGLNTLNMTATGKEFHYYYTKRFPMKSGDKLIIEAEISGKGQIAFGTYFYGAKDVFSYSLYPFFSLPAKPEMIRKTISVENRATAPSVESGIILLVIPAGSEAAVTKLNAWVEPSEK